MHRADLNILVERGFDAQFHILEHLSEALEGEGLDDAPGIRPSDFNGVDDDYEDFDN